MGRMALPATRTFPRYERRARFAAPVAPDRPYIYIQLRFLESLLPIYRRPATAPPVREPGEGEGEGASKIVTREF